MSTAQAMDEKVRYQKQQEQQYAAWEKSCLCCGACCGVVDEDPCENLECLSPGKYSCRVYENRFGLHKTLGRKDFKCVPIREILNKTWPGDQSCVYKKIPWNPLI